MKLLLQALMKFTVGLAAVMALLFWPAGTWRYTGGWLFLGLLFVPIAILGVVLFCKAPDLLRKRLDGKEKASAQKGVVAASALLFIGGFVVAGLDVRFGWSHVPLWVTVTASALFLLSYALYAEVMRENAYLSRTIEVQEGQTVVDTGLYGIVRHPMYAVTVLLFLMIPLILGSWWALLIFALYPLIIAARIRHEETLLLEELDGYRAYTEKVKYKLIPLIW